MPLLLEVRRLGVTFGPDDVFRDVSFHMGETDRLAVVGPNGCGKSTLLAVLAGRQAATAGALTWHARVRVASLGQEDDAPRRESGGEAMRRRIAAVFAEDAALVLLDEPTNHLDAEGRRALLAAIARHRGAVVVASHDRQFIDEVATRLLAFGGGTARLFDGGHSHYRQVVEGERQALLSHEESWRRERDRLKELALRQRQWAERAHAMAGERNPSGKRRAAKAMKKALASEGRLRRHDAARPPRPLAKAHLKAELGPPAKTPPYLVRTHDLAFAYRGSPAPALSGVSLALRRGERWRIGGANGAGKSTLIALIAGAAGAGEPPAGDLWGTLDVTAGVTAVAHRQGRPVDPHLSGLEQALAAGASDEPTARTLLAVFGLAGETALRPAASLSPGEAVRLAFALDIVSGPDLLILDEPTNHLDLPGREALEEALRGFGGTVVFSSHDEAFARAVATHTLELSAGRPAAHGRPAPGPIGDEERLLRQVRLAALEGELVRTVGEDRQRLLAEIRRLMSGDGGRRG